MPSKQYFTVAEANSQIPSIKALFIAVMQVRGQLKALYERLESAGYAPTRDDADELPEGAPASVMRDRARFYGLVEALREQVEQIHATGCQIKDIETGLVDWLARDQGREILLCWRLGETQVEFWHEMDTGFAGRRPVSELSSSVVRRPTGGPGH
jgi:hypothetical protein